MLRSLLILVAVVSPPLSALGSTFDAHGFGTRGAAMGNALTAAAQDYHAIYYNPAQLMERLEVHVGFGVTWVEPRLSLSGAEDGEGGVLLPGRNVGVHLGISTPLGGVFDNKVAFGAGFFAPLVRVTRAQFVDSGTPHWYLYENLPDKLLIAFAGAAQPWPWLKLGVGVQVLADLDGTADVRMSLVDQRVTRRRLSIDLHADLAVTAGVTVTPLEGLNLAVSYRQALDLAFALPVRAEIEELGALTFDIAGTSLYTPHQVNFGASWRLPWLDLRIAADLTWALWSLAPSPSPEVYFAVTSELAGDGEPLLHARSVPVALDAVDVVIPRFGVEYGIHDFHLRAGYVFRPTPLPTPVYQTNYVDSDAHVLTVGADWTFKDPLEAHKQPLTIGLSFQATVMRNRPVTRADPADPAGDYTAGGAIFSLGLDVQHDF